MEEPSDETNENDRKFQSPPEIWRSFRNHQSENNRSSIGYNIDAIIEQLDASTYSDQRPLYITAAEMTSIKQQGKTLQEYHDAINQALNLVVSRILLTYKLPKEQKVVINQVQIKAVRTFIIGLKSHAMRNLLYGGRCKGLSDVYKTAQTIYYDNQYLELDCEAHHKTLRLNLDKTCSIRNHHPNLM